MAKFKHRTHLVVHRGTHSGERPFQCDQCPKTFKIVGKLVVHRRAPSGDQLGETSTMTHKETLVFETSFFNLSFFNDVTSYTTEAATCELSFHRFKFKTHSAEMGSCALCMSHTY